MSSSKDTTETQPEYRNRIKSDMASAEAYTHRKQDKHDAEMDLIRKALKYIEGVKTFLDIPCGAGRATILLAGSDFETTGADLGDAVASIAAEKVKEANVVASIEQADLEKMPYDDSSFDAILCFRLYHHFPDDEVRARAVSELCRVAKKYVLISYLHPYSVTSIRRKIREKLGKKQSRQNATSLSSIEAFFNPQGYRLIKDVSRLKFVHSLHLAVFERQI